MKKAAPITACLFVKNYSGTTVHEYNSSASPLPHASL
jgi:hypothetical protein